MSIYHSTEVKHLTKEQIRGIKKDLRDGYRPKYLAIKYVTIVRVIEAIKKEMK